MSDGDAFEFNNTVHGNGAQINQGKNVTATQTNQIGDQLTFDKFAAAIERDIAIDCDPDQAVVIRDDVLEPLRKIAAQEEPSNEQDRTTLKARIMELLEKLLRSQAVPTSKREEWIERNGRGVDVMIGNPRLTSVGLDLFQRDNYGGYKYNFCSLIWYETSLSTSTTRQASGRSWRIGQTEPCKVIHLFYENCLEARLVQLMGQKCAASEAIDGRYSTDGLSALNEGGEAMGLALARSLLESMQQRKLNLRTAV